MAETWNWAQKNCLCKNLTFSRIFAYIFSFSFVFLSFIWQVMQLWICMYTKCLYLCLWSVAINSFTYDLFLTLISILDFKFRLNQFLYNQQYFYTTDVFFVTTQWLFSHSYSERGISPAHLRQMLDRSHILVPRAYCKASSYISEERNWIVQSIWPTNIIFHRIMRDQIIQEYIEHLF